MSYCPDCKQDIRIGGPPHACPERREREANDRLALTAGSPSSDTPETDGLWDECEDAKHTHAEAEHLLWKLARKLERERDALKAAGVEIIEAARRSMPRKHGTIERNAKLFFPENAKENPTT